jgi:PadR family transcriptional regulator, regulatory protein PadR
MTDNKTLFREVLLAFWKIHILHHAAEGPVVGQWMLKELRHHGYDVSPGTLYPLLQRLERHGWLRSKVGGGAGSRAPRSYYLTATGREVLDKVQAFLEELRHELRDQDRSRGRKATGVISD